MVARMYRNWRSRHLHPASFALHLMGIPACFVATPILLIAGRPGWAAILFGGGYVLQFLGHWIEHNRSGEEILIRRLLRRP